MAGPVANYQKPTTKLRDAIIGCIQDSRLRIQVACSPKISEQSILTLGTCRTTVLQGAVHLAIFCVFLLLEVVP